MSETDESDQAGGAVLVVVSDLLLRGRAEEGLKAAGYRVRVAAGPTRMAERLIERPRCMVIDLEIAGMDAPEAIAALRAHPTTADLPVLGFCGHVNVDVRKRALAAGADRVATRGEIASTLPRLIEKVLARTDGAGAPA